jgi:hypothetical protein
MFPVLLTLHSWVRWLVLMSLVVVIVRGYWGFRMNRSFSRWDTRARVLTVTIAHTQFLLGLVLYSFSPIVDYFLQNFNTAVHMREIRFFGLEHITMMVIAVGVLTIGSIKTKKKQTDREKFKTMLTWFTVALLIIFLSIPWSFSPFTSRPLFRPF